MEGALRTPAADAAPAQARVPATMCEAFQLTAAANAERPALRTLGDAVTITFAEYAGQVKLLAAGLHALGTGRGDTVGFMLTNRPEFHLLDAAAMHLGATPFSIYNTSSADQIAYLLADAGNRIMIVEAAFLDRALAAMSETGTVQHLIVIDGDHDGALSIDELERLGAQAQEFDFDAAWRAVKPDDVLTLIYTSGTTGPPKGVMLTHANEIAQCRGIDEAGSPTPGGSIVSALPHAHIADRGLSHYGQMYWGNTVSCCPDITQLFTHVAEAQPTFFGSVPRIWEKLKAALESRFAAEPDPDKRDAVRQALEVGLQKVRLEQAGEPVPEELQAAYARADAGLLSKLRAGLGLERCEWYMVGAAPTPVEVLEFFAAIGIPICEVWGMSELSSIATMVPRDNVRFGTVGIPLPGVEVKLDSDGEVLVRGATMMAGYRHQPAKTAEAIGSDGWLRTGDIGAFDDAGFLKLIDRKKELIINASGKNMSPANIEGHLKSSSPLIGQAMAIGDGRPYNVALLVLDPDNAAAFAAERGLPDASLEALAVDPAVLDEVKAAVERANSNLSRVEQIKRFKVLPNDWPPAGDELTPTMKLKRKPIAAKYAAEIEALYAG
jgi:long-subunit acyl-CoA synthetase (AMP-forming)